MKKGEEANNAIYKSIYITGRYGYESYLLTKLCEYDNEKYKNDVIAIEYQMIDSVSRGAVYYVMQMRKEESQIPFFDVKEAAPIIEDKYLNPDLPQVGESDLIVGIGKFKCQILRYTHYLQECFYIHNHHGRLPNRFWHNIFRYLICVWTQRSNRDIQRMVRTKNVNH